ncbi:hypothetical protein CBS63078_1110 [Aspergillus niger]|nr:hypothetical protein CBS63078_1110 [Aspergillus niger]
MDDCELDTASDDFTHSDNEYGWEGLSWDERVKDLTGHLRNGETWESMESAVSEFRDHDNREVPTLLHHLSKDKLAHGFYDLPESTRVCILDCLLQVHLLDDDAISEHAQANEIGEDETPFSILISALKHINISFLNTILANLKDPLLQLLQIPHGSKRRNPLHEGFRVLFLKQRSVNKTSSISNKEGMKADLRVLTRIVHDWVELAPQSALEARDNDGNTPLHYAMNYNLCYYLDAKVYRPVVVALIDKSLSSRMQVECLFNKEGKSPYLIYLDSESWFAEKQHTSSSSKPAAVNGVSGSKSNLVRLGIEGKRVEGKEKPGEEARRETQNEPSQPLSPPDRFQTTSLSLPPRWVRNPKVLLFTQDNRKPAASESMLRSPSMRSRAGAPKEPTPYHIQQSRVENSRRKEAADEIRQYLRLCYLRNMSDVDAKNLLYGNVASDKNLYFDATHLRGRGPAQIVQLFQKLARAGGFDDTLSYVKIPQLSEPYWLPEPASKANTTNDKRGPNGVGSQQKATVGRNALVSVFDELAATGVQRILRLQVEDHGHELAHSDTAIERAIRGWNYRGESDPFAMANMILRINPWIRLLVIRIHDGVSYANPSSPSRTIHPDSAAHAVEVAIKHNVDVISMSWTLRKRISEFRSSDPGSLGKKSIDEPGIERLEKAIKEAADNNILMVCSAADDIELLGKDNLPFCAAEHNIFRIGSCNSQAQRDPMTENRETISYFLPGIQVPEARRPHSVKPIVYHDGSSIATALAAGLISMILHCARYMAQCRGGQNSSQDGSNESELFKQRAERLRMHKNMQTALNNIVRSHGSEGPEDPKQLPVYGLFAETANKLENAIGWQKIERLGELVRVPYEPIPYGVVNTTLSDLSGCPFGVSTETPEDFIIFN